MTHTLHLGDCRTVLATLDDASIDAIVCDPPYELNFMGRTWDNSGIAYDVTVWQQCLRVLKPGGHLVAFGGSRTYHRLAVAIEDAGFEIRDQIQWIYGSGFPKSLDVSKAMDKQNGDNQLSRRLRFTEWVRSTGLTTSQIDKATGTFMGSHYTTSASQPAIMTRQHLDAVRHLIDTVPDWVETEVDIRTTESEAWKSRPVVTKTGEDMFGEYEVDDDRWRTPSNKPEFATKWGFGAKSDGKFTITAPATDLAKQWQGWGTALKPAHEPAVLARKPLCGTVADNVMAWGVGALNIDGTRVGTSKEVPHSPPTKKKTGAGFTIPSVSYGLGHDANVGRWPANVILDEDAAVALDAQSGVSGKQSNAVFLNRKRKGFMLTGSEDNVQTANAPDNYGDVGGASRFFYIAKASRSEREAGLDAPDGQRANIHTTVKPLSLMRYLVRLVTPKHGKVLDPFMGSGSTGCAAVLEGFDFVGIDITPEYVAIAQKRVDHYAVTSPLMEL
jgi:DNA modification methylase